MKPVIAAVDSRACPVRSSSSSSRSSSTSSASGSSSRCCRSTRRRSAPRRSSIGLLFASFSLSQLVASPLLGDLSDRWGRRPVLIFSLIGTVVSFVMLALAQSLRDAVRRAHRRRAVGRQHHDRARLHRRRHHRGEPREGLRRASAPRSASASSSGRRLAAAFSHISYTAPIWAAAVITRRRDALAWFWLPETVHRAHAGGGSPWHALRESERIVRHFACSSSIDFLYWMAFAVYQTTFALFGARRFGFDATHTGYLLSAFGFARRGRPGRAGGPDRRSDWASRRRWLSVWSSPPSAGAAAR